MTFSVSLLQALLIVSTVFAGAAAIFIGGRGRILQDLKSLAHNGWKDGAARRLGMVLIDPSGEMSVNHGARTMFGGFSGEAPTRRALLDRIKDVAKGAAGRYEFEQALSQLSTAGASFSLQVETKSGKRLDVIGEPRGASVSLALHDVTDLHRRMVAAEDRAAEKTEEAQLLAAALETADVATARVRPNDVGDLAALVLEELAHLHRAFPSARAPIRAYHPGKRFPSHVFQRTGLLERLLEDLARSQPGAGGASPAGA